MVFTASGFSPSWKTAPWMQTQLVMEEALCVCVCVHENVCVHESVCAHESVYCAVCVQVCVHKQVCVQVCVHKQMCVCAVYMSMQVCELCKHT